MTTAGVGQQMAQNTGQIDPDQHFGTGIKAWNGANKGTREIRVILYAKEPSYVPRLDTRVNPSDFAGAPPVA